MIFPFYWMIATAFKDTYAVYEYPPKIFPNPLVVSNFGKVWELLPFGQAFVNSIKIVLTVVVIQLLTASMAAFAFAKLQFKFRELIFLLVLATMMIQAGVTKDDVDLLTHFYVLACVGLLESWLLGEIDRTPEELIAFLDRILKEHICGARFCWSKAVPEHSAE